MALERAVEGLLAMLPLQSHVAWLHKILICSTSNFTDHPTSHLNLTSLEVGGISAPHCTGMSIDSENTRGSGWGCDLLSTFLISFERCFSVSFFVYHRFSGWKHKKIHLSLFPKVNRKQTITKPTKEGGFL